MYVKQHKDNSCPKERQLMFNFVRRSESKILKTIKENTRENLAQKEKGQ